MPSPSASAESGASVTYATQQSTDQRRSSKIVGQAVYNAAGERIGDVNELIPSSDGKVESRRHRRRWLPGPRREACGSKLAASSRLRTIRTARRVSRSTAPRRRLRRRLDYKYAEDRRS